MKHASADALTLWISGKVCDRGEWGVRSKGRITALLTSLMRVLVYHRDHNGRHLDTNVIRANLSIDGYVKLAYEALQSRIPEGDKRVISTYLTTFGYVDASSDGQQEAVKENHAYLEALTLDALRMIDTEIKWEKFNIKRSEGL
jgi:hypothetical protein